MVTNDKGGNMSENEKRFSTRRFVSLMTLCTFMITGISGIVLLLSHGPPASVSPDFMINWKGMHEIACIFFVIFGTWHFILNFKTMCRYFMTGKDRQLTFRMDWVIPIALAIIFFATVLFIPGERHGFPGYHPAGNYQRGHHH